MNVHMEGTFEAAIEAHLLANGYLPQDSYDSDLALDTGHLFAFIEATQPDAWAEYVNLHGDQARSTLLKRIVSELERQGSLGVLRNGVVDYGQTFKLAFYRPATTLAPDVQQLYDANRLSVMRQVPLSGTNETVDMVLFVNGIPVVTIEVKTPTTSQTVEDAVKQYKARDHRQQLFRYAERALVHFAVDPESAYMATRLSGKQTRFLPYNIGRDGGAGNPDNPAGYKTDYLWEDVWQRDSLLELVQRFINIEYPPGTKKKDPKKGVHIFPRYHQRDVVRQLEGHARAAGPGHNYLVQHSAGSGKSNSIAWTAHRLYSLHNQANERVFHSVVVITDRRVLDQQLQDTIYGIEHQHGVVHRIDGSSQQLADALATGAPIIISTLQKFPVVIEKIGSLPDRNYAVIVDEAHSSQTGEAARKLRQVLTTGGIANLAEDDEDGLDTEEAVLRVIEASGRQPNLSFFAFTATPKPKTLEMFGSVGGDGKPRPFHVYSMRQAIEEGFIMDVLAHYTTYNRFFKLTKAIEDDPEFEARKAQRAIARFVDFHPANLSQKAEVIVEHFRQHVRHRINGQAKGIVITKSRAQALGFYRAIKDYCEVNEYLDIGTLVAFSGSLDTPTGTVTETSLNGFPERELPGRFDTDEYQLLVVAEKYQTGFDQPKLHTMYVDKKLDGVHAVQTLSRLNRTMPGKDDTFVLDFVNEMEDIQRAFEPYYEAAVLEAKTDPALLYDLKHALDDFGVYRPQEVEEFAATFFKPRMEPEDQAKLFAIVDKAVGRFENEIEHEDDQEDFRTTVDQYLRMYGFLTHVISFKDTSLEKLFAYGKWLRRILPSTKDISLLDLDEEIDLEAFRLQFVGSGAIPLHGGEELTAPRPGGGRASETYIALGDLIREFNERFGTDFSEADMLLPEAVHLDMLANDKLAEQAKANTPANFRIVYEDAYKDALHARKDRNEDVFLKLIDNNDLLKAMMDAYFQATYKKLQDQKTVPELIEEGESATVEFKASARWGLHAGKVLPEVEDGLIKTVAGFLNADGGTLLVGVVDRTGEIAGLDNDIATVKGKDLDGYENWMTDRLISSLKPGPTSVSRVAVSFVQMNGSHVARLEVAASPEPVYAKTSKSEESFFVRIGNSTRELSPSEVVKYVGEKWRN